MNKTEYILLKLAFTEYGQSLMTEFIEQLNDNKVKKQTTKALSKEYVTLVKDFIDEMKKDKPNEFLIRQHLAKLGCQHYKMYLSLKE